MSPETDTPRRATLREAAVCVLRALVDAGFEAYFAGGCVRDRLMGLDPTDYDIATSARPDEISSVFRRSRGVGESFGVMLVRHKGHTIEVATFRTDGVYSDGRHPDAVTFSDAEHDAARRDFTINGIFEDPLTEQVIDYVGGERDIRDRIVRAIGDPDGRLREDRLRMLRAVRFAARLQFAIEAETAAAIRAGTGHLEGVSRERIGQEIRLMFTDRNRAVAAWELQYLDLDGIVLQEPGCDTAPLRMGRLPDQAAYTTALAAWALDRMPGPTRPDTAELLDRWTAALMLSNDERKALGAALDVYGILRDGWEKLGVARQKRLASGQGFREGLAVLRAEDTPAFLEVHRRVEELALTGLAPEPLINGEDLIGARMTPGPMFRRVLDGVYDAQLEGSISTRTEALTLARAILESEPGDGQPGH